MKQCRTQIHRMDSVAAGRTIRFRLTATTPSACATILLMTCCVWVSGCRSLRPSDGEGLFGGSDLLSTSSIKGPLERVLNQEDENALAKGQKFSAEGRREVDAARRQYDDGKYVAALKKYKSIAKKYEGSSIGEEAWFRMGECHYAMKQYPDAQDAYEKLFADYPSTKYVSDASQRMFTIAKVWLEVSDPASKTEIKTVSQSVELDPSARTNASPGDPSARFGLLPNFTDKTRPFMDTRGRALKALKSIWLNDPTGPLADDALMLTASYYLRRGNNVEADRYFQNLRELYPESPHLEQAFVLGSHAKQMSYQGPHYDQTALISAKNLKEQTLTMFPNSDDRAQVREDLKKLYLYEAQAAWARVEFYQQKDNPASVAIQCRLVIENYPDTRYGEMARRTILAIDPAAYRKLPGITEFVESLPSGPSASQGASEPAAVTRPPVKSVGDSGGNKRRFRFPGF